MAVEWGSYETADGKGMRVGIDVAVEPTVGHNEASCTFTVEYWTQNNGSFGGWQKLNLSGAIVEVIGFTNDDGNTAVRRATRTYIYTYDSDEYGKSPGTKNFTATMSGITSGITPSKTRSEAITARPYGAPAPPSTLVATRISDTSTKLTWTNNSTPGEPYSEGQYIDRLDYPSGSWLQGIAVTGAAASTWTDSSTVANKKYQYRIQAQNAIDLSAFATSPIVYTTPAIPGAPTRTTTGADQVITWTNPGTGYAEYVTEIWHAADGAWDGAPLAAVASGLTSYTHLAPSSLVRHKYRVRHKTSAGAVLYSAYTAETTETIGTTSAPAAPTGLSPNGVPVNPALPIGLTWTHNSTDGTGQRQYQVRHRVVGNATWTTTATIVSAIASYTLAAGAYTAGQSMEWQVATWGTGAISSAWSASATLTMRAPTRYPVYFDVLSGRLEADSSGAVIGGGGTTEERSQVVLSTGSLASGATATGAVSIAPEYRLLHITTTSPCRTRLYTSAAQRTADDARIIGTDPAGDHGVMLEYVSTLGLLSAALSPTVDGYTSDETDQIPWSVTNTDSVIQTVTVTLDVLRAQP